MVILGDESLLGFLRNLNHLRNRSRNSALACNWVNLNMEYIRDRSGSRAQECCYYISRGSRKHGSSGAGTHTR